MGLSTSAQLKEPVSLAFGCIYPNRGIADVFSFPRSLVITKKRDHDDSEREFTLRGIPCHETPSNLRYIAVELQSDLAARIGWWHRDVFLTREEISGLTAGLLESSGPTTGNTRLTEWAKEHASELGRVYASEMRRRREREVGYQA